MKPAINLLQETQKIAARLRRMGLVMQTASIVVLIVFGVVIFLLISYTLLLGRQENRLSQEIGEQKLTIQSFRTVEIKQTIIQQKLAFLRKVVDEPSMPFALATRMYDLVDRKAEIGGVETLKGKLSIQLSGESGDVFSLVDVIEELIDFAEEEEAVRLTGQSFNHVGAEGYKFSISFVAKEE